MLQDLIARHHHRQIPMIEEDQALMVPWLLPVNLCNRAADNLYHNEGPDADADVLEGKEMEMEKKERETKRGEKKKKKKKKKKKEEEEEKKPGEMRQALPSTQVQMAGQSRTCGCTRASDTDTDPGCGADLLPGLDETSALRCLAFVSLSDRPRLAQVGHRYRGLVRSPLLFDLRRMYGVIERWVCIFAGGDGAWAAYDPRRDVWLGLPPAHGVVDPVFALSDRESLAAGAHLLWLGREAFEPAAYRFDLSTSAWEPGPPMVTPRCLFASASCGALAFVAGGFKAPRPLSSGGPPSVLNTAELYDSRTGAWRPLPPMQTPRQKCSGVFMDGKFYVIGGKDKDHNPLTSGEAYDPSAKTWTTILDMYVMGREATPSFEPSPPLIAVADNRLYSIDSSTNLLKGYDKRANAWKVLGPVPMRTDVCNGWGLAFKALGDELVVIGGYRESPASREGVAIFSLRPRFDAAAPDWHPGDPLPEWKLVNFRIPGSGSFLYNCAVMAC